MSVAYKRNPSAKRPPGRPALPPSEKAKSPVTGYVTERELKELRRRAPGGNVSELVRDLVRAWLKRGGK